MESYDTLVEAMAALKQQGYTEDFNLQSNCLECQAQSIIMQPDEFNIDKTFRFEGDSNPSDSSILYAVSSEKYKLKGLLVNAYGTYADPLTDAMTAKLKF